MLIAVIVLSVAVVLLGIGILLLLKINQAHVETNGRLQLFAQSLAAVQIENDELKRAAEKQKSELDIAHQFLERLIVVVPDDVSLLKKIEKEEVTPTSTEKEPTE